jgi:CMP/dCMP kinase
MRADGGPLLAPATRTLTIGGYPGTGTTTACRALEKHLGLTHVYAGQIFREQAAKMGMTLEQFGAYAEAHPEIDQALDARQAEILRGPPVILEGRLSGFLAFRDKVPAFKVWFTCDPYVRARRLVEREGGDADAKMAEMRRREDSERRRYLQFYGYDVHDLSVYDLVLDTTELTRDSVVDAVLGAYGRAPRTRPWWKVWAR